MIIDLDDFLRQRLGLPITADPGPGWAAVKVMDDANAPAIHCDDWIAVNRNVKRFNGDAVYLVGIDGIPLIRYVQMRGNGLHVFAQNAAYASIDGLPAATLCVLGRVERVSYLRSVSA